MIPAGFKPWQDALCKPRKKIGYQKSVGVCRVGNVMTKIPFNVGSKKPQCIIFHLLYLCNMLGHYTEKIDHQMRVVKNYDKTVLA